MPQKIIDTNNLGNYRRVSKMICNLHSRQLIEKYGELICEECYQESWDYTGDNN